MTHFYYRSQRECARLSDFIGSTYRPIRGGIDRHPPQSLPESDDSSAVKVSRIAATCSAARRQQSTISTLSTVWASRLPANSAHFPALMCGTAFGMALALNRDAISDHGEAVM